MVVWEKSDVSRHTRAPPGSQASSQKAVVRPSPTRTEETARYIGISSASE